jgi:hypothetical protein
MPSRCSREAPLDLEISLDAASIRSSSLTSGQHKRSKQSRKMDIDIKELIVLALLACFGLVLAWVQEENLFAAVFAAEAAVAVFEAVYLSARR